MTPEEIDLRRLRWQCRRGMLELDLLLMGFLEQRFRTLSEELQGDFVRLLEYPDPLLHDWLLGKGLPPEPQLKLLVEMIRSPNPSSAQSPTP